MVRLGFWFLVFFGGGCGFVFLVCVDTRWSFRTCRIIGLWDCILWV